MQPTRFQGQFFDQETSLHYNRFRYYDTDVGMFIQRDPIGLLGGVNVFAYAPNPIHWVDPLGLERFSCVCINKTGGGTGKYTDEGKKICTYSCTGKKSGKIILESSSSESVEGSEYCRGAILQEVWGGSPPQRTYNTKGFKNFAIDTQSWYWDGWGDTKDIYNQLIKFSENNGNK